MRHEDGATYNPFDDASCLGTPWKTGSSRPAFLPSLCRFLTGEDLLLESHPTYWCGGPEGMRVIGEGLKARIIAPAMAWPGGIAVTASDMETLTTGPPELQLSKDVWILSEQPVEPFSLLGGMDVVPEVTRGSDLPSRVADHLLWLGRYLERAEGMIRVFRCFFRRLSGEARPKDIPELPFLLNLLRSENIIPPAERPAICQSGRTPGAGDAHQRPSSGPPGAAG